MSKYFNGANSLRCDLIGEIDCGQDGAICDNLIFRLDSFGNCFVRSLENFELVDKFQLNKMDYIIPHVNSACFSYVKQDANDRFPYLYLNVYNNYKLQENRHEGECCVYRITEKDNEFSSQLVQIIKIGFVGTDLWKSRIDKDICPYGNFVVDEKRNRLIVFVMQSEERVTRVFEFNLPSITSGEDNKEFGSKVLVLTESDILDTYDVEYSRYLQGATCDGDYLYSSEGFAKDRINVPAIRVIDLKQKKMVAYFDLMEYGVDDEPEFLEVYNDQLYYSDAEGRVYKIDFVKV